MSVAHSETLCWLSWGGFLRFPHLGHFFGICVFPSTLDGRWEGTWGGSLLIWIPFTPPARTLASIHAACDIRILSGQGGDTSSWEIHKYTQNSYQTPFNHPVWSVINCQPPLPSHQMKNALNSIWEILRISRLASIHDVGCGSHILTMSLTQSQGSTLYCLWFWINIDWLRDTQ